MYAKIRRMFYREHLSINEIQRRTSLSRNTIKKWLKAPSDSAVKYQRAKKPGKLIPFESRLLLALEADARRPRKDRRTAKMLFQEIRKDGYVGGYTIVCDFVRNWRTQGGQSKTAYVPLKFTLGAYSTESCHLNHAKVATQTGESCHPYRSEATQVILVFTCLVFFCQFCLFFSHRFSC
jgi:transposase